MYMMKQHLGERNFWKIAKKNEYLSRTWQPLSYFPPFGPKDSHLLGQKSGFLSERLHRELPRTCCQAPRPSSASKPLFPCIFPAFFHIFNNLDLSIQIWALGKGTLRFKILCHLNHRCCSNNTIYVCSAWKPLFPAHFSAFLITLIWVYRFGL